MPLSAFSFAVLITTALGASPLWGRQVHFTIIGPDHFSTYNVDLDARILSSTILPVGSWVIQNCSSNMTVFTNVAWNPALPGETARCTQSSSPTPCNLPTNDASAFFFNFGEPIGKFYANNNTLVNGWNITCLDPKTCNFNPTYSAYYANAVTGEPFGFVFMCLHGYADCPGNPELYSAQYFFFSAYRAVKPEDFQVPPGALCIPDVPSYVPYSSGH